MGMEVGDHPVNESAHDCYRLGISLVLEKKIEMAWEFAGFSVCDYLITWNESPNIFDLILIFISYVKQPCVSII